MREILFRGKRLDNGEWVDGNLFIPDLPDKPTQICMGTNVVRITFDIAPETVGQFTGLTDKNGTKIFEGDILRPFDNEMVVVSWIDHYSTLGLMVYATNTIKKKGREKIETHTGMALLWDYDLYECEVIGNIHDNPELLARRKES